MSKRSKLLAASTCISQHMNRVAFERQQMALVLTQCHLHGFKQADC